MDSRAHTEASTNRTQNLGKVLTMLLRCLAGALVLAVSTAVAGEGEPLEHQLLVFGSAEVARVPRSNLTTIYSRPEVLAADVLFTLQRGPIKLLGEFEVNDHESDLERFQIGWEPSEHMVLWLGRFHQPGSIWNSEYHHGQYLQTPITRPGVENWDDDGGVIPQQFTGVLTESNWNLPDGRVLKIAAGSGLTSVLTPEGLKSFDLLRPNADEHRFGYQGRVALMSDQFSESGAGLVFAKEKIAWRDAPPALFPTLRYVDFTLAGAYATYAHGSWKLQAVGYYIDAQLIGTHARDSDLLTGYVTVEDALTHNLRVFVRREDSSHLSEAPYLRLFPLFPTARSTLAVRWDFMRRHALTAELADTYTATDHYMEYRLQWSAALL
jgi:hypothetical protein